MEGQGGFVPEAIGVIGAGTMGAGIAQLAAQAGARTLLHDAVPDALERGVARIEAGLSRSVERGRLTAAAAEAARERLEPVGSLEGLRECGLVIEAAPERLELKLELFGALAAHVAPDCVLATNTSSLSVTEIAAGLGAAHPERVVGMHFFNPPPVMRLLEVVAGEQSDDRSLQVARAAGEAMGKTVIDAADVAGFLVNRVNRPFSLVSLRLLQERVATVEQIDRIVRMEGGFRLGPFELQDLIGLDVNHAVAEVFQRASYGEARYQPSPLQAKMIAAGRLGRKTGRGWYSYEDGDSRPPDPPLPAGGGGQGRLLCVVGELPVAEELARAAASAGFEVRREPAGASAWLTLVCGAGEAGVAGLRARLLHDSSLHASDPLAAGFHVVPPLEGARLIEVTRTARTEPQAFARLVELAACLGRLAEEVGDAPGLVLGRLVAALVNEAAFLIGEGNGSGADVDVGMELGLNHPRGPVAWSQAIGLGHVVAVLDALRAELGEERYRAAPLLRRRLAVGEPALA